MKISVNGLGFLTFGLVIYFMSILHIFDLSPRDSLTSNFVVYGFYFSIILLGAVATLRFHLKREKTNRLGSFEYSPFRFLTYNEKVRSQDFLLAIIIGIGLSWGSDQLFYLVTNTPITVWAWLGIGCMLWGIGLLFNVLK